MRSALTAAKIFDNLQTDVKGRSATFTVGRNVDFKKTLDEIAVKNKHVHDYEIQK
ncbi:MAG: hypothetical protein VX768_07810 [Planctomycetota bacterium]|nr:hypothetical protein [Planctomycetota bacterium]